MVKGRLDAPWCALISVKTRVLEPLADSARASFAIRSILHRSEPSADDHRKCPCDYRQQAATQQPCHVQHHLRLLNSGCAKVAVRKLERPDIAENLQRDPSDREGAHDIPALSAKPKKPDCRKKQYCGPELMPSAFCSALVRGGQFLFGSAMLTPRLIHQGRACAGSLVSSPDEHRLPDEIMPDIELCDLRDGCDRLDVFIRSGHGPHAARSRFSQPVRLMSEMLAQFCAPLRSLSPSMIACAYSPV